MYFTSLRLTDFRNFEHACLTPHQRFSLLVGSNAQGKTNLLEALYLLSGQRSFRAQRLAELIRFGTQTARVQAELVTAELERQLTLVLRPSGKTIAVDGKARTTRTGLPTTVLFSPDDLQALRRAPADRRRLLDTAIASVWPTYTRLLQNYEKTLQNRNRVLKRRPAELYDLLAVYDSQLAHAGARVIAARTRYLAALAEDYRGAVKRLADGLDAASLAYQAPRELLNLATEPEALAAALEASLAVCRREDLARGFTTVGPHCHDIEACLNARPARRFASQGQLRTLMLAFKIAQLINITNTTNNPPVLLLDDVSSELDAVRNQCLFDDLERHGCQVFVTSTRPELLPLRGNYQLFHIVNGSIQE